MKGKTIYIVEDDENIREMLVMALASFGGRAVAFENAEEALDAAFKNVPDMMIFDIMLPGMNGIEAVVTIRANPKTRDVPVIMLTAKDTEMDRVTGLDRGADDYVAKPFGIMELGARIRSVLRRAAPAPASETMTFAGLSINPKTREVVRDGTALELTPKEYDLLLRLAVERDRIVTREELLKSVWGYNFMGETRTLDIHVRSLRQKLGDDADNPAFIKTARGVGYRFVGEMA